MQNTPIKNIAERNADNALVFDILFPLFYYFSHLLPLNYVFIIFYHIHQEIARKNKRSSLKRLF